jgi:hypothetical protein
MITCPALLLLSLSLSHSHTHTCTHTDTHKHTHTQEGEDFDVVPNSQFTVSRTANRNNTSDYYINDKRVPAKDVGAPCLQYIAYHCHRLVCRVGQNHVYTVY